MTLDSGLKTNEEDSPDSGDEEPKEGEGDDSNQAPEEDDSNLRDPTDEELLKELDKHPLPPNLKEMGRLIMPFSVEEYWTLFHAKGASYTFEKFFQYRGFKKIDVVQEWTDQISEPNFQKGYFGKPTQ